ncbi:FAD-dependent oxidoreductase [Allokutzneria albata]|uniref:2-polyprenyl-6-methoxyphenol hydroxylase n=1 Tax=Allokutzneria albata TaxID=211114 RepID=A0A1G9TJI5_ALLAB|nr:FAD-dependent monooxygenase [Allokutzneria albata]SDM47959.1 2-polyprenyl-6-methoxyphenol hydroxylase [Allokutzneria albata]
MSTARTALVIGGGIAGPVAAMALRRAGVEATVFEAHPGPADGVGGGLGLAPNGLNALGLVGAEEAVREIGIPVSSMVMRSWTGKELARFGEVGGPPIMHTVWRSDLYRALCDTAERSGVRIEHGKRLKTFHDNGDSVTASFVDGSTATADILVGADGVRSAVRGRIDPSAPGPRSTGLVGFGGWSKAKIPYTDGAMNFVFGKRAFFSYTVEPSGRVGWFANLPRKEFMTIADAQAPGLEHWLRVLREAFADDRVPAVEILRGSSPELCVTTGTLEIMRPAPRWHRGRVVLIGDAVHVPSPSSGQGASQAIEGAVHLARCLRDLPIDAAFRAYEGLRRERVERITTAAERTNRNKAAGPVTRLLRDLLMPPMMRLFTKPDQLSWQYDYRIDWDARVA